MIALEPTQKRALVGVVLATLTGTSFFVAQGTTQLVASAVLDAAPEPDADRARRPPPQIAQADRSALGRAILQRDIFDHETGALEWDLPPPVVEGGGVIDQPAPGEPQPCDGSIRLVASYFRPQAPEQSFAAITNQAGVALLYAQGMSIDEREVMEIHRNRVYLKPSGSPQACFISMFNDNAVAAAPPQPTIAVAPPEAPAEPANAETADLDANIQQTGENQYAVNRSLVDRLLANQAELMRTARVIPHEVDGRVVGVKVYGIRRSSVLGRLGIQNGDMLRTINGYDLTEPDSVLEAYSRLRTADRLSVSLDRRGSPVSMDYSIR